MEGHASPANTSAVNRAAGQMSKEQSAWRSFVLVKRGLVSKSEVFEYLDFFFETLWPLKPVIPSYYRDRDRYSVLAKEEPLLLTCLVTIASRYTPLSGPHGEIRSERIHWQSWKILQRYLQSVLWGSTITRSLGAITSMLLLIEWHMKSVNNPMDFAEAENEMSEFGEDVSRSGKDLTNGALSLTGQQRYGLTSVLEKLNIVSAAYRSNKMSWYV